MQYMADGISQVGIPQRNVDYHWHWQNRAGCPSADYIIVDEFSMVDIWVMQKLVTCIPDFSRLLLVGDADQLPSVQCGAVLHDLIESLFLLL